MNMDIAPERVIKLYAITALIMGCIAGAWSKLSDIPLWYGQSPTIRELLIGLVAGLLLFFLNVLFYVVIRRQTWFHDVEEFFREFLFPLLLPMSYGQLFLMSVLAGIFEELLFRGVVQHDLGLIAASFLFGLVHSYSPKLWFYGLWVVGMGFILGILMEVTGTLFPPMVAHGLYDFLALVTLKILEKGSVQTDA